MTDTIAQFLWSFFLCALCMLFHTVVEAILNGRTYEQTIHRLQNDVRVIVGWSVPVCIVGHFFAVAVTKAVGGENVRLPWMRWL